MYAYTCKCFTFLEENASTNSSIYDALKQNRKYVVVRIKN